jgi:two-component system, chemotaxis family, protein-glutamate methylesterase/glutaminase
MTEEPIFIRRRISHYGAMSKLDLDTKNHATILGLLAGAERNLAVTTAGNATHFPVVCVGGSAGGLDAYIRLLKHLPTDMGVAIVIVNHLRIVATQLHKILPRYTRMPVDLITEGLVLQPNRVFIIPAKRDLHVFDGEFRLKPISKPRGWPNVITVFLCSLTRHWDGKIIAVIVSGYDGDGAAALCGIKEVGGIIIAQKLETAGQPDMPESAIATGFVDFIMSPEDIAQKIAQIVGAKGGLTRARAPSSIARDRPR